jgi:hypothetical protein
MLATIHFFLLDIFQNLPLTPCYWNIRRTVAMWDLCEVAHQDTWIGYRVVS